MKIHFLVFAIGGLAGGVGSAAEPNAELMTKIAARQVAVSQVFTQGALTMTTEAAELDGDGKPVTTHEFVMRLSHPKGQRAEELVRATEDGKDVLEAMKKKRADNQQDESRRNRQMRPEDSPFSPQSQPQYRFHVVEEEATGHARIHFEPRVAKMDNAMTGEALVDTATGDLLSMRAHPTSLPTFVDRLEVTLDYGAQTPQGRTLSKMTIEGQGGLLFIKRRFRATMLFTDFALPAMARPVGTPP